ncbi:MAG TPA: hypothetical protein IAC50_06975 [Candidatus Copromorpha excrementigallinarum]|uniref:ROK family protein n=1 Tax=Candidatus Allocopromorpha excrementigallinarum TaxID=2840742 RepID=A0A9D1I116_9FIRM|nr:hypothetical protein [Candidatus Copromorpha excrementigallinarum]
MKDELLINNKLRVKESNTNLVISTLKKFHTATCAEISKNTGLSVATCGNILKRLLESGEILDGGFESNSSGRPAKQYTYNKNFSLAAAVTIHEEQSVRLLQYAVADLYGDIIEKNFKRHEEITSSAISSLISELTLKYPSIRAIGFGVPAIINKDGEIINSDISELNGANIYELLKTPDVNIKIAADRSPALSIYGYHKKHPELKGTISAAVLCPQVPPVGAGFVINDQIYNGYYNIGGEIGFLAGRFLNEFFPEAQSFSKALRDTMFTVAAIVSTINPSTMVFMGTDFSKELFGEIQRCCEELFDPLYMPELVLLNDYSDEYIRGTIQIAIDCLNPKVKLVME